MFEVNVHGKWTTENGMAQFIAWIVTAVLAFCIGIPEIIGNNQELDLHINVSISD